MTQAHIFYSGKVQGVGFRYTTEAVALNLGLKGWVRNLADGRVEIVVEGKEETIKQFCEELEEHFEGYIKNKEITIDLAQGKFRDFGII